MGIEALLTSQVIGLDAALTDKLSTSGGTVTGQLTNALGTITASTPLTISQTWNNAAVTFTGALVNVTDTASASGSLLADFHVGGSSKFSILKTGQLILKSGVSSPWFSNSVAAAASYGFGMTSNGGLQVWFNSARVCSVEDYGVSVSSGGGIRWSGTTDSFGTADLFLVRDAAQTLAQRNSTNAQTFRLYNTYTSATSFENLQLQWSSNEARIGTSVGSAGGTQRSLVLGTWNSAGTWTAGLALTSSGYFGIGTSSPQVLFDIRTANNVVSGLANVSIISNSSISQDYGGSVGFGGVYTSGGAVAGWASVAGRKENGVDGDYGGYLQFATRANGGSSAERMRISSTGNVGIGTSSPTSRLHIAETWNNVATTFTGILANVTDTASASGSLLLDLQVGGSSIFNVRRAYIGGVKYNRTSLGITQYSYFTTSNSSGFVGFGESDSLLNCTVGIGTTGAVSVVSGGAFAWNSSSTNIPAGSADLLLYRDAARTLALRDGVNANVLNIYNTYTSSTSYERGKIAWESNVLKIGTEKGSAGGSARALELQTDGVTRLTIGTTGTVSSSSQIGLNNGASYARLCEASSGYGGLHFGSTLFPDSTTCAVWGTGTVSVFNAQSTAYLRINNVTQATVTSSLLALSDAVNIAVGTTTGTKIGTGTTQKIGFWNAAPIVQPTTGVASATSGAGMGTAITDDQTFDGYTVAQVVKALRNIGLLA